jgi:hypothetical protein
MSGDESRAEIVLGGWFSSEGLESFELTWDDIDGAWGVGAPIAEYLGLDYEWRREGDEVTMTFTRPS